MGRDVLGCAQTGTGKTAGFTLPMIDILAQGRARARMPRSLILEPTRELAAQVSENFEVYGKHNRLSMALLIGGTAFDDQVKKLDRGVDVLIATPGRLIDHIERGHVILTDIKILVIDEADRMLDMGFIPDIERIVRLLPKIRQTLFFSATMPPEIRRLADAFLMNPKEISVAPPASPAESVTQALTVVNEMEKREALRRLIRTETVQSALVFCNRKRDVDILQQSLKKHGFSVAALHGDMDQSSRTATLERFRRSEVTILVASDVAARGLDIDAVSHVFNFDVPIHAEDYVHRIGRTGRAGRSGKSFTLATPDDGKFVAAIEQLIKKAIPRIQVEGLEEPAFAEGDSRRRSRGGRGGRGRSNAKSDRAAAPHEPKPQAPAPVQAQPKPQPHVAAAPAQPKPKSQPRRERERPVPVTLERSQAPRQQHEEADDAPVAAFGSHMPAFMRRAVPVAKGGA
jgi:superfamily II DNA/RNA helicase